MEDYGFSSDGIILVLGVTGAGKSYFINKLKAGSVEEGHSLQSQTTKCQAVQIILDDDEDRSITIVDTPGFDDTLRPHGEVLAEITEFLAVQHTLGMPLKGVLYFHKITENCMTGSSLLYLSVLESIVGRHALKNVFLVTTMWNKLRMEDYGEAYRNEQDLLDNYWRPFRNNGAFLSQFDGSVDASFALVWQLAGKRSVVLDIQREIIETDQDILHTAAGRALMETMQANKQKYEMRLAQLELRMKWEPTPESLCQGSPELQEMRREEKQAREGLEQIDFSIYKMQDRPKRRIKEKIKRLMSGRAATGAAAILATALNITFCVMKPAGGG